MTREDAVTTLKDISEMVHKQKEIEKSTLYGILDSNNEPIEALDMAIKALEQEPCEDCISRQEALKCFTWTNTKDDVYYGIKALSSIQPKTECSCEQIKWERDIAIEQLHELGYELGQKIEPCEDCISRKAVLDALNKWDWQELYLPVHFKDIIDDLPSIQPKTDVLDKIMKEIKEIYADIDDVCIKNGLNLARRIINKYKAESEDKE